MNATILLAAQHRDIETLLARMSVVSDPPAWRSEFESLARALIAHDAAEREIFYPACACAGIAAVLEEPLIDHLVEFCLYDQGQEMRDATFAYKLETLKDALCRHVEQERVLFPRATAAMRDGALEAIGETLRTRFEQVNGGDYRAVLLDRLIADVERTRVEALLGLGRSWSIIPPVPRMITPSLVALGRPPSG